MAYEINKTNGTVVAVVADGQIDRESTGLTLIGKNYSGFGEALNENLVKILENFADTKAPTNPIKGQLWYDTAELKLKVYSGIEFLPVSSASVSARQPEVIGIGDLWYNNRDKQLYFFNGTEVVLLGPQFSTSQGTSGVKVDTIVDTQNQNRVITSIYTNGILMGIFAKDKFVPRDPIVGFSEDSNGVLFRKEILPGFNIGTHKARALNNITGALEDVPLTFRATVENSERLGNIPASTYLRSDTNNIINGQLRITSDLGIILGNTELISLLSQNGNFIISNGAENRDIIFETRTQGQTERAVVLDSSLRKVEIFPDAVTSELSVNGDLVIAGNLSVNGTTTFINTENVTIEDKTLTLANSENPDDVTSSIAGIIVAGTTDHVLLWSAEVREYDTSTEKDGSAVIDLASYAWTSSEDINLINNREFKINGVTVLSATSLGNSITSIPGVVNIGKQDILEIGPGLKTDPTFIRIEDNKISSLAVTESEGPETSNGDLLIEPTGNIILTKINDASGPQIKGMANPTDPQDAATKEYVDGALETRSIALSIDISNPTGNLSNIYIRDYIINELAPPAEFRIGTKARVLCTSVTNLPVSLDIDPLLVTNSRDVLIPEPNTIPIEIGGIQSAIYDVSFTTATVAAQTISVTRSIKVFELQASGLPGGKSWNLISDNTLPTP